MNEDKLVPVVCNVPAKIRKQALVKAHQEGFSGRAEVVRKLIELWVAGKVRV